MSFWKAIEEARAGEGVDNLRTARGSEIMLDYDSIKKMAKSQGKSYRELLVLAPQNDPFYTGSPAQVEKAEWFAKVYEEMGAPKNVHIRRVHYALVARADVEKPVDRSGRKNKDNGKPYENTERDWQMLEMASKYARYLELVPMENFVDRRNPEPEINAEYYQSYQSVEDKLKSFGIGDVVRSLAQPFMFTYNPQRGQAYHLELWCEKSTMNDVIMPVAYRYNANVITGLGEMSITAVRDLISRVMSAGKPTRIFYISDFDPAGECMPVSVSRKIECFLRKSDSQYKIKLKQLMLTKDQCIQYELPRTPIKESDLRKAGFEARHGTGATELDALEALHPGDMEILLTEALDPYFDKSVQQAITSENNRIYSVVRDLLRDGLSGLVDDLVTNTDDIDQGFELPLAELIDEGQDGWILILTIQSR